MKSKSKQIMSYIKLMISTNKWKINEPIPSIKEIADKTDSSYPTVKKVIKELEYNKILNNWGKNIFLINSFGIDKTNFLLYQMNKNFDLTNRKIFKIYPWLFNITSSNILCTNEFSNRKIKTTLEELLNLNKLISLKEVLTNKTLTTKYNRQRELLPIYKIVTNYKKEFGI